MNRYWVFKKARYNYIISARNFNLAKVFLVDTFNIISYEDASDYYGLNLPEILDWTKNKLEDNSNVWSGIICKSCGENFQYIRSYLGHGTFLSKCWVCLL